MIYKGNSRYPFGVAGARPFGGGRLGKQGYNLYDDARHGTAKSRYTR